MKKPQKQENENQKCKKNKGKTNDKKKKELSGERILHILKEPNANGISEINNYLSDFVKVSQDKISDCENQENVISSVLNNQKNVDAKLSEKNDCGVPKKESKPSAKIPKKQKKPSKNKETVAQPVKYHSIFDNNLLRDNGSERGCECTSLKKVKYGNPFFSDCFEEVADKKTTINCTLKRKNVVNKIHALSFDPIEEFQYIATQRKPTLYVSEYVTCGKDAIGCKYSLIVKLAKNNIIVGEHVVEHIFTKTEEKFLEIHISDYSDFDYIYYYHSVSGTSKIKLNLKKVFSVTIGKSVLMFLSDTIQWTKPGPKVIVEMMERLPEDIIY